MRRTLIWSAALVVVMILAGVAWYSAAAGTGAPRAATSRGQASPAISPPPRALSSDQAGAGESVPPGGISRDQAVAIAGQNAHMGPGDVESAVVGRFGTFTGGKAMGSPTDLFVWAVTFSGFFVTPCMAPPAKCQPDHHETVLLDYFKGTVLIYILKA